MSFCLFFLFVYLLLSVLYIQYKCNHMIPFFFCLTYSPLFRCGYFLNILLSFWGPPSSLFNNYSPPSLSFLQYNVKLTITTVCQKCFSIRLEQNRTFHFHTITCWCYLSYDGPQGMGSCPLDHPETCDYKSLSVETERHNQAVNTAFDSLFYLLWSLSQYLWLTLRNNSILDLVV